MTTTMMKFLLPTSLIVCIFCSELASAYISPSSTRTGSTSRTGGHNNNNAAAAAEKKFQQIPANVEIDDIFREEYHLWSQRYGKSGTCKSVEDRICYENFKLNFMLQMQHNKKTGTFNLLNEFGDMSIRQFDELVKGKKNDGNIDIPTTTDKASLRKKSNGVAVKAEIVIEKAATVTMMTAPIPKVSILGPTSKVSPMNKNRNRNNHRSAAGLADQARNSNGNMDNNHYSLTPTTNRSHRKIGPDRAPYVSNSDTNNIKGGPRLGGSGFAGVDKASEPRPRKNRRLVRWVGPDKIL